jgi:hypothetical protein
VTLSLLAIEPITDHFDGTTYPVWIKAAIGRHIVEDVAVYRIAPNGEVQYHRLEMYLEQFPSSDRQAFNQRIKEALSLYL